MQLLFFYLKLQQNTFKNIVSVPLRMGGWGVISQEGPQILNTVIRLTSRFKRDVTLSPANPGDTPPPPACPSLSQQPRPAGRGTRVSGGRGEVKDGFLKSLLGRPLRLGQSASPAC